MAFRSESAIFCAVILIPLKLGILFEAVLEGLRRVLTVYFVIFISKKIGYNLSTLRTSPAIVTLDMIFLLPRR